MPVYQKRKACSNCENPRWLFCDGKAIHDCYFCCKEDPVHKDDFIEQKSEEWHDAQDRSCSCHTMTHPPCSFCEDCYSLPLAEFLELALEEEYGPSYAKSNPHEDYDRAMKDLF